MNKKLTISILLALLLTFAIISTAALAQEDELDLVRLTIDNRTDQPLTLAMTGMDSGFYLTVRADSLVIYTVPRGTYRHTTYACGETASGDLDMSRQLKLVFPTCYYEPSNHGTPSIEKIFLPNPPPSVHWQYQLDK